MVHFVLVVVVMIKKDVFVMLNVRYYIYIQNEITVGQRMTAR